ncbi:MAG: ABC transporter permease [Deltaproteobacteria bacterium]|jgi:spermidine/putrescine transport system permease protein|nr:ABC transporter permease [Deltaproteobacteria bacterium]
MDQKTASNYSNDNQKSGLDSTEPTTDNTDNTAKSHSAASKKTTSKKAVTKTDKPKPAKPKFIIWRGELTSPLRLRLKALAMAAPPLFWLTLLLGLPCLMLGCLSVATRGQYGGIVYQFTTDNLRRLVGYTLYGWNPAIFFIILRSIVVALITTILCILLAYPLTFHIATRPPKTRVYWLILLVIPFWTNMVVRAYAWLLVLAPQMPPAKIAAALGLIPEGTPLYPGSLAVYLGMVSTFLPFMALPLYSSVERLNWEILEAAKDLYASKYKIFMHAILPQTRPGLSVGIIVTFVPSMAMFVVTDILGGAKTMLIGNLIQQQFAQARDWPFGAALSMTLMLMTLISMAVLRRRKRQQFGQERTIFSRFS